MKEKAKAFINLFRDNRIKAKKTEEASKKVEQALKASEMSLQELFLSAVKPEHLKPSEGPDEVRVPKRKPGQKVDLNINSLAARLTDSPTNLGALKNKIQEVSTHMRAMLTKEDFGMPSYAFQLDKMLFGDDVTEYDHSNKGDPGTYGLDYIHAIAARLRSTAADVDVISTDTPEKEINGRLAMFDSSKMAGVAMQMASPLANTANEAAKELEAIEKEISALTGKNVRLANEDPLLVKARRHKAIVQGVSDINDIYGYVMKSWTDLIQVGAKVVKDPNYGAAA
ncbi:hypothetical protein D3C78_420280 [compost metagenome]